MTGVTLKISFLAKSKQISDKGEAPMVIIYKLSEYNCEQLKNIGMADFPDNSVLY